MATNYGGDLSLVMPGFHQGVYLVSLSASKLPIVHCVLLLTWRLEKHAYAIAACSQPPISKVALQVESTICHCFRSGPGDWPTWFLSDNDPNDDQMRNVK